MPSELQRADPRKSSILPAGVAVLALCAVVAGCATPPPPAPPPVIPVAPPPPPPAPPPPPPPAPAPVVKTEPGVEALVLAYSERVRTMAAAELAMEITRQTEAGDVPQAQVQLALALLQTHLPADTARSLGLLQKVVATDTPQARPLHPLARLLAARAFEQRRLEDQIDRQNQQLRDNQRRIDQLNERLEAVRAIERSLTAPRPGGPGAPPPAAAPSNGNRPPAP
ncbi:hypothetical protein ACO2Q9_13910 [Variovorax sp. VNK109]|uniref:hypothetical protein n=1 Tax=Variovorax sp. VNK109 TaxID=3400919 RepID=UPI003BFF636B